jgi:hypothetical protein
MWVHKFSTCNISIMHIICLVCMVFTAYQMTDSVSMYIDLWKAQ